MVGAFFSAFPCGETEALKFSGCCKSASVIHVVLQGLRFEPGRREGAAVLTGEGGCRHRAPALPNPPHPHLLSQPRVSLLSFPFFFATSPKSADRLILFKKTF